MTQDIGFNTENKKSLEREFENSLKDDKFRNLVQKVNLPREILQKYTSLLEESACEYSNCQECKNIFECKNKTKGYAYLPKIENDKLVFKFKACKYQEKLMKDNSFKKKITLYQTPDGILEADMKKIYLKDAARFDAIEWLTKFVNEYPKVSKGLYLHGNFGSGKSYLINSALCELAKKGFKSTIVFWPEFLRDLKSYFGNDIEYREIIRKVKNSELLFIDDIGAENVTPWSRDEILNTILQYRMDNKLCTFFTSNFDINDLERHLGTTKEGYEMVTARRITERIKQLTDDIELISKNLRG
jgi:primosomal protein DnaI